MGEMKRGRRLDPLADFFPVSEEEVNVEQQPFEFNVIYHLDLTGQVKFGKLPEETLYKVFQDGRAAARLLEHYLVLLVPGLVYVDAAGHDFVLGKVKLECKCYTRTGLNMAPSHMVGKGRKIDKLKLQSAAKDLVYIFCDITTFPKIRIVFQQGSVMIKEFPNGHVKFHQGWRIFPE